METINREEISLLIEKCKDDNNKRIVLEHYFKPLPGTQLKIGMPYFEIDDFINLWTEKYEDFTSFWLQNEFLRLSQVLIVTKILDNYPGFWYHTSNKEILKQL